VDCLPQQVLDEHQAAGFASKGAGSDAGKAKLPVPKIPVEHRKVDKSRFGLNHRCLRRYASMMSAHYTQPRS
jgi:hypothetical protein